jgi:uncharacterized protein YjbJ (UPF0337 family)
MKTTIQGFWDEKKEKLKEKFSNITDEDLRYYDGKEREMMEVLSYKLGKTREELAFLISSL